MCEHCDCPLIPRERNLLYLRDVTQQQIQYDPDDVTKEGMNIGKAGLREASCDQFIDDRQVIVLAVEYELTRGHYIILYPPAPL